jgi:hypothetical protein
MTGSAISGAGTYLTNTRTSEQTQALFNVSKDMFFVIKITFKLDDPLSIPFQWSESNENYEVIIDKKEFASGKTKQAFKGDIDNLI